MKLPRLTKEQFEAHQKKHGFMVHQDPVVEPRHGGAKYHALAPRSMNQTEHEFSFMLEAQKRAGEILRWCYEGITLRWGGLRYTPDFVVFHRAYIKLIETKGGYIRDDALVKFKAARAHWLEFQFEMHQKRDGRWVRLY